MCSPTDPIIISKPSSSVRSSRAKLIQSSSSPSNSLFLHFTNRHWNLCADDNVDVVACKLHDTCAYTARTSAPYYTSSSAVLERTSYPTSANCTSPRGPLHNMLSPTTPFAFSSPSLEHISFAVMIYWGVEILSLLSLRWLRLMVSTILNGDLENVVLYQFLEPLSH